MNTPELEGGVTAQYRVFFRRATLPPGEKFVPLEPGVHRTLYERPVVQQAVKLIQDNPVLQGVVVLDELGLYNIVTFVSARLDPMGFIL